MTIALSHYSVLVFSGEKAADFLQGQLTCDVRTLASHGSFVFAACCDHRGRMVGNFWVIRYRDQFLFVLPKVMADIVKAHLEKYAVFSKVSIHISSDFFIYGVFAEEDIVAEPDVIRLTLPTDNRCILLAKEPLFLNEKISDDETDWKRKNIHHHFCILYPDTSLLFTPQMIGLDKLGGVSLSKGCYVGQEIIARTTYLGKVKRHLQDLKMQSDQIVKPGDAYYNSEKENKGVVVESIKITENTYEILAVIQDEMFYNGKT